MDGMSDPKWHLRPVRALCCECGTLRMTSTKGARVNEVHRGQEADGRCLVARKCATCRTSTLHAYLRDNDPYADYAEQCDRQAVLDAAELRRLVDEEVDLLRACEIHVRFDATLLEPDEIARIIHTLTDGAYLVLVDPDARPARVLRLLEFLWQQLAGPGIADSHWKLFPAKPGDPDPLPFRMTTILRGS